MLIYGHKFIPSSSFYHIPDIATIQKTPSSSAIYIPFSEGNLDIINHAKQNDVIFALGVKDITEIIYASALGASFIFVDRDLAKTAQSLANEYLFDAKILATIDNEDEIEELALLGVDGVVFSDAIIKINS